MSKGRLQVYCGSGRGKTTAAIGQAIKEASRGKSVFIVQFLKERQPEEISFVQRLEPEIKVFRFQRRESGFLELTPQEREEEIMNMKNALLKIFCLVLMFLFNAMPSFAGNLHFQIYSPETNTVIKTDLDENDVQNFSRKRDSYGESINIKFNKAGAVKLKKLTTEHVGKELAIQHLNSEFLFSAKIMEPINGGEVVITS